MQKVVVAMSGGIDSSVTAYLLKRRGLQVTGVFMSNWDERDETGACGATQDFMDVQRVCERLALPCQQVEFVKEYWNEVFSSFLHQYQSGHTPNPDILCNQKIKFASFYNHAITSLKATAIATGHYAQLTRSDTGVVKLLQSADTFKDQSYFLCQVPQAALQNTQFPIGHLTKAQVRALAWEAGLGFLAHKKESMGLCFVGKRSFSKFISQYLDTLPGGTFVDLKGRVLGEHDGHHLFTIGQRARIGGQPVAWFVVGKDTSRNAVLVAEGTSHPALYCHSFTTERPHWISGVTPEALAWGNTLLCTMRYRHQQSLVECTVSQQQSGELVVRSEGALRAVSPGQCAAFYVGAECLGGAFIRTTGPSLWELGEQLPSQVIWHNV